MKSRQRNLHVPLSDALHQRLHSAAARRRAPATAVARYAIESWLDDEERSAVHEAVAEYARSTAGSRADLDLDLEKAGVDHLTGSKRKARK